MMVVGLGLTWLGYSVFYYGLTQVQSGNWGLLDLMLPGRTSTLADVPRDGSAAAGAVAGTNPGPLSTSGLLHLGYNASKWFGQNVLHNVATGRLGL